jgi:hypothetical protein
MNQIDALQKLVRNMRGWFGTNELIIAGGAPRDILSGVPIKDIDIFLPVELEEGTNTQFYRGCGILAAAYGGTPVFQPVSPEYPDCYGICDIQTDLGLFQVIGLDRPPLDDLQHYDFGLSQVAVTPTGLLFTEAAFRDRQGKTITYTPHQPDAKAVVRSQKRLARLRAKYEGWQFVNCESLDAGSASA